MVATQRTRPRTRLANSAAASVKNSSSFAVQCSEVQREG